VRVLLIGADSSIGLALQDHLRRWGRHQVELLNRSACRWKSERQAKKAARRGDCDILIDTRIAAALDSGEQLDELDFKRCHWLAKACQRSGIHYLYLSSARVFSGTLERQYRELDEADNTNTIGRFLREGERLIRETCEKHIILRMGPVFSSEGPNVLTHHLALLLEGGILRLENSIRVCPLPSHDGARVLAAILDQISAGADPWGTYHYCSSDPTNEYEFAEALLAGASQFNEFSQDAVALEPGTGAEPLRSWVLDSSLLRDTFGVKQVPWRGFVADAVKQYFKQRKQE